MLGLIFNAKQCLLSFFLNFVDYFFAEVSFQKALVPYFLNFCIFCQDKFACPLKCFVAMGFRGKYFYSTFENSAFLVLACPA
jgi:hypothetical protein